MEILKYYFFSSISLLFLTNYFFLDAKSLSPLHFLFLTNVSLVADVVVVVQLESGSESESESESEAESNSESEAESNSEQESEANLEPDASDPKPLVKVSLLVSTNQQQTRWGYGTTLLWWKSLKVLFGVAAYL